MNRLFASPIRHVFLPSFQFLSSSSIVPNPSTHFDFSRPRFGQGNLVGTVQPYDRHVFLCHGSPSTWQPNVESSDGIPRLLLSAINARKEYMKKRTKLTICNGESDSTSSGDIMLFPDMIRYRQLRRCNYDNFIEEVLMKESGIANGLHEKLMGTYVFVCSHGSRDKRCGVCGPLLVQKFQEEIKLRGFESQVYVKSCSHIGGHRYAGNVIIFGRNVNGEASGHWYGYVTPDDVALLLDEHIGSGNIIDRIWRGQMGLSQDDQKKAQNLRLQNNE